MIDSQALLYFVALMSATNWLSVDKKAGKARIRWAAGRELKSVTCLY